MTGIEVFCWSCAAHAAVNKVTATLRCGCGSDDVDLWDGGREQLARVAAVRSARTVSFVDFMTKQAAPATLPGWNEYQGPMPGKNPMQVGPTQWPETDSGGKTTCPVCHGSGFSLQDGGPCRECGGSGKLTPNTTPEPPAVARHNYPSTQTKVPFMGQKRVATPGEDTVERVLQETTPGYSNRGPQGPARPGRAFSWNDAETHFPKAPNGARSPHLKNWEPRPYEHDTRGVFPMPGASCPNCGADPTHLKKDYKEDAWWTCPNCGPLANVDRNPSIDPYSPGEDFKPNGKAYRESKKIFSGKRTGILLARLATIVQTNPGLTSREALGFARSSVRKYPEAR